jgi:hypothetical protein
MTTETRNIDPGTVRPAHESRDAAKLATLTAAMTATGWDGRPLLAYEYTGKVKALTGSHRIAAACASSLTEIPVLVIADELIEADEDECGNLTSEAIYNARRRAGGGAITVGDVLREVTELCELPAILRDLGVDADAIALASAEDC